MTTASKTETVTMRTPFPAHQISKLPKETRAQIDARKTDKSVMVWKCEVCGGAHHKNAVHLDYVGHAALTDRMLDVDAAWSWEPVAFDERGLPAFDHDGGLWIKLTIDGVTRMGYGDADGKTGGNARKEAIGDALRNAAMRFGAALDLWHKGDLHLDGEGDEQGQSDSTVSPAQPEQAFVDDATVTKIIAFCEAVGGGQTQIICKAYKVDAIPELTPKQGQAVIARLNEKLAEKAKSETNAVADDLGDSIPY